MTTADDPAAVAEASRDWWPLALHWALAGEVPCVAAAVARPRSVDEVAAVIAVCAGAGVPLTAAGGRSGVCGASVPAFGGVVLDLTGLAGIVAVDDRSGVVEVLAGTFGPDLEQELQAAHGLSVGHFPQSFDLATVGGWVACRGAGQYSTRYGKIEDLVVGLEVVLADGTIVRTGGAPAAAVGPDLTQLFVGSEGTLGVVTRVWLRTHPVPPGRGPGRLHVRDVRRRRRRLPPGAAPRRHPGRAAALRRGRVGSRPRRRRAALDAARAGRGRPGDRGGDDGRRRRVRGRPAAPPTSSSSPTGWSTATTPAPCRS